MLYSTWLTYLVEVYSATSVKKFFDQKIIYFSVRTGKMIQ